MQGKLTIAILSLAVAGALVPFGATGATDEHALDEPGIEDRLETTVPGSAEGSTLTVAVEDGSLHADVLDPQSGHEDLEVALERCYFDVFPYRDQCETGISHVSRGEQVYVLSYRHGLALELVDGLEGDFQSIYTELGNFADLYFENLTCSVEDTSEGFEVSCHVFGWGPAPTFEAEHMGFAFPLGEADPLATGDDALDDSYRGQSGWSADGPVGVWLERT